MDRKLLFTIILILVAYSGTVTAEETQEPEDPNKYSVEQLKEMSQQDVASMLGMLSAEKITGLLDWLNKESVQTIPPLKLAELPIETINKDGIYQKFSIAQINSVPQNWKSEVIRTRHADFNDITKTDRKELENAWKQENFGKPLTIAPNAKNIAWKENTIKSKIASQEIVSIQTDPAINGVSIDDAGRITLLTKSGDIRIKSGEGVTSLPPLDQKKREQGLSEFTAAQNSIVELVKNLNAIGNGIILNKQYFEFPANDEKQSVLYRNGEFLLQGKGIGISSDEYGTTYKTEDDLTRIVYDRELSKNDRNTIAIMVKDGKRVVTAHGINGILTEYNEKRTVVGNSEEYDLSKKPSQRWQLSNGIKEEYVEGADTPAQESQEVAVDNTLGQVNKDNAQNEGSTEINGPHGRLASLQTSGEHEAVTKDKTQKVTLHSSILTTLANLGEKTQQIIDRKLELQQQVQGLSNSDLLTLAQKNGYTPTEGTDVVELRRAALGGRYAALYDGRGFKEFMRTSRGFYETIVQDASAEAAFGDEKQVSAQNKYRAQIRRNIISKGRDAISKESQDFAQDHTYDRDDKGGKAVHASIGGAQGIGPISEEQSKAMQTAFKGLYKDKEVQDSFGNLGLLSFLSRGDYNGITFSLSNGKQVNYNVNGETGTFSRSESSSGKRPIRISDSALNQLIAPYRNMGITIDGKVLTAEAIKNTDDETRQAMFTRMLEQVANKNPSSPGLGIDEDEISFPMRGNKLKHGSEAGSAMRFLSNSESERSNEFMRTAQARNLPYLRNVAPGKVAWKEQDDPLAGIMQAMVIPQASSSAQLVSVQSQVQEMEEEDEEEENDEEEEPDPITPPSTQGRQESIQQQLRKDSENTAQQGHTSVTPSTTNRFEVAIDPRKLMGDGNRMGNLIKDITTFSKARPELGAQLNSNIPQLIAAGPGTITQTGRGYSYVPKNPQRKKIDFFVATQDRPAIQDFLEKLKSD